MNYSKLKSKYNSFFWVPCTDNAANAAFTDDEGNVIQADTRSYFRLYGENHGEDPVLIAQGRDNSEWDSKLGATVGPNPYPHLD